MTTPRITVVPAVLAEAVGLRNDPKPEIGMDIYGTFYARWRVKGHVVDLEISEGRAFWTVRFA